MEKPQPVGREALEDLLQRVKFMEVCIYCVESFSCHRSPCGRRRTACSHWNRATWQRHRSFFVWMRGNKLLVAENSELKQELGEVKQTQAELFL